MYKIHIILPYNLMGESVINSNVERKRVYTNQQEGFLPTECRFWPCWFFRAIKSISQKILFFLFLCICHRNYLFYWKPPWMGCKSAPVGNCIDQQERTLGEFLETDQISLFIKLSNSKNRKF